MVCKVGTIKEIRQRLVDDGYHVTEYALRQWVKVGLIPSVCSGKKIFITFDHVVEFLTTGSVVQEPMTTVI